MALRSRNPSEPRRADSPTKRIAYQFKGMISGEPPSKISPDYSLLNENVIDHGLYATIRCGSTKYTNTQIGYLCTANTSSEYLTLTGGVALPWNTGDMVYFVGDHLPAPLVENTAYFVCVVSAPAGIFNLHTTLASAYNNGPYGVNITTAGSGDIWVTYGPLNAKCDHVKAGKLILMFGKSVYIANKAITSLTRVANFYYIDPDGISTIVPFGDDAILASKTGGMFKIFLTGSFYYMVPINGKSSEELITDAAASVSNVYGYLYNYSLARITGATGNINRISDGALLQIETGTNLKDGTEKDYGEVYFQYPVGVDLTKYHSVGYLNVKVEDSWGITHFPLYRTKDIGAGGSSSGLTGVGNRRDQMVWVEDVPVCKALIVNSTTPGQLTATSGTFVLGDVGSRITVCKGASAVDCTITGYTSPTVVTITGTPPSSSSAVGVIGGFGGGTASQTVDSGRNTIIISADKLIAEGFYYTSAFNRGMIIFVSDGSIRHVDHIAYESGVYKFIVKESGLFTNLAIGLRGAFNIGDNAFNRKWNDTVPDMPQADARVSLMDRIEYGTDLYVPRRLFRPIPNCDIIHIDCGFLVAAVRDGTEYHYCQTGDKGYCIGQYKYPEQYRKITGSISHICGYPFVAFFALRGETALLTLNSSSNIGRTEIGENIFQLPELSVVDNKRGIIAWKSITYKNSNIIYALTNDSAFRVFSGTAWSAQDYACQNGLDAVSKEYFRKIDHNNIKGAIYNSNGGIKLWFQMMVNDVLTDICLRFATEPGEGYGWSVITGSKWVFPIDEIGVFDILDDNDVQRVLVIDKKDYKIYEIDTFDRSTTMKSPVLDKDTDEIAWRRRGIEHIAAVGSENKRMIHEMSYVTIEPVDVANRGATGYTVSGQRAAQELTLKTFFDGERVSESARASDFPENGEVVFTGRKKEANKILMELSGTAGECNITDLADVFLIEERAPTRSLRVMTEHTMSLSLLADKALHICKSETLYNRVTQNTLNSIIIVLSKDWIQVNAASSWSARWAFGALFDGTYIWVAGGYDGSHLNDIWRSADGGLTWTLMKANAEWSPRAHHAFVYLNGKYYVYGGSGPSSAYQDVWSSNDCITWTFIGNTLWQRIDSFAYTVYDNKMWLFGGQSSGPWDVFEYSSYGVSWHMGHLPNPIDTCVAAGNSSILLVLWRDRVYYSTNVGSSWYQYTAPWGVLIRPGIAVLNDVFYVTGGQDGSSVYKNDTWTSPDGLNWTKQTVNTLYPARNYAQLVAKNSVIHLLGGFGSIYYNDVWKYIITISPAFSLIKVDGPDGKTTSGFQFTGYVSCDNPALANYTIVLWSKDTNLFYGITGFTAYGSPVGGWQMYYKTGTNLPAGIIMLDGSKFDIRIYSKILTAAEISLLYEDTVSFAGKMLLPGFIGA